MQLISWLHKVHIVTVIDELFEKNGIFLFNSTYTDTYGSTLKNSKYVGLRTLDYEKAILSNDDNYMLFLLIILSHEIAHLKGYYSYKLIHPETPEKFLKEAGNCYEIELFGKIIQEDDIFENNLGKKFFELAILDKSSDKMRKFFSEYSLENMKKNRIFDNKKTSRKKVRCLYKSFVDEFNEILNSLNG